MSSLADKLASGIARILPIGGSTEDPLVSLKSATRWLENQPVGDAYKCQQAIFNALKRFNENTSDQSKDRLAIFMLLDERSRDLQETLVRQYLRNPRMSRMVESQLWHAVYGLNWEIARGYHGFVLQITHESGRGPFKESLPLITLRAIRAFDQLLKWRAIRYLPASEKLWLRLHNLYRIAEMEGFNRRLQQAYAGETSECSCESAFLHTLMLNLANSGTLYPKQLDLLDRWLCVWHTQLELDTQLDPEVHNFVIDLSADHGPRRVRKPDSDKPMRFWSTHKLLVGLQEIHGALQKGQTPEQINLPGSPRTAESLELIDHLLHQWASLEAREQRRAPRATTKRLVDVVHGLNALINQIKLAAAPTAVSPYGTGLSYNEADDVQVYGFITDRTRERVSQLKPVSSPDVERWVMHDESDCGFGAVVESRDKDWLRVGALVGIKSHESATWRIGIVRRLSRVDSDTSSIGIETLPEAPTLVMLSDTSPSSYTVSGEGHSNASLPHAGLLMTRGNHPDSLILDPVYYLANKTFRITGLSNAPDIVLGTPLEHSEGWIHASVMPDRSP
ncbi:MAG: hypothetical protein IV085_00365 [Thiobacillus sp.]|nr:hypothetical protein [Thiobacillus sp.]